MKEKFELSLWRDYFPSEDEKIDIYNIRPGKGIKILTDPSELVVGKCYYLYDNGPDNSEEFYWRYPCSYTHRQLRPNRPDNGEADNYYYWFIDERGAMMATQGFYDKEIGLPTFRTREEKLMVLANENMELYRGKIYNIHFISKTDGTHTITFQVPQFYRDFYTQEKKKNEYLDWLQNKTKLKLLYDDEWYDFVINKRNENKSKGYIVYDFEANDLFIEELSKTGYTLNLTDSEDTIEYSGLGTIGELTDRVLAGTEWRFSDQLTTADLKEYQSGTKYNAFTNKYEDTKTPTMVYKSKYSPALKKYVYETEYYYDLTDVDYKNSFAKMQKHVIAQTNITKQKTNFPIYYTTQTQVDCSGSTNNLIVTNSNFTDIKDWKSVQQQTDTTILRPHRADSGTFYLNVNANSEIYTTNFTEKILESKAYGFRIDTVTDAKFSLSLFSGNTEVFQADNLQTQKYEEDKLQKIDYIIYPNKNISSPELRLKFESSVSIVQITLYELAIRDSNNSTLPIIKENLGVDSYIQPTDSKVLIYSYQLNENYPGRGYINEDVYVLLPNSIVAATARPEKLFFIEPYKNLQEVQYATGDNTIQDLDISYIFPVDENFLIKTENINNVEQTYAYDTYAVFNEDKLQALRPAIENQGKIIKYTNEFHQDFYYTVLRVEAKDQTFYLWKNVFLKYTDQKRRLITGSRSNRFNFIQDFAEKFEVYPKFFIMHNNETGEIIYDENNQPIKWVYYVDRFGNINYSGFKDGINVNGIKRKIISDNVVTKMYVDNLEADYKDDGYVSIQLANKNPSLENYIYNFKHYLNAGMLDKDFQDKLNKHLSQVKQINEIYLRESVERDRLADTVNELKGYMDTLNTSFEESKATVENRKLNFSINVDYYGGPSLKKEDIASQFGNPLIVDISNGDFAKDTDNYSYNNFYCINDAQDLSIDDKLAYYTFFIEQQTIYEDYGSANYRADSTNNNNNINGATGGTYAAAQKEFLEKFYDSVVITEDNKKTYLLDTQVEKLYKNESIPFNESEKYYIKVDDTHYKLVANPIEKDLKKYYLRYITSCNSEWYYWGTGKIFVYCEVYGDNNEYRRIGYLLPPKYVKNQDNLSFTNWLVRDKGWHKGGIYNVIIPAKQNLVNSERQAIDELITGSEGQIDIIPDLHSARVEYYNTLAKYREKVIYINRLLTEKKNLIEAFEKPYIQFIKEGYWGGSGKQYVDDEVYFLDAVSAGNDAALPKTEYTIDVIDLASIEYYKDHKIRIGDETFIKDVDMFGSTNGRPNLERMIITVLDRQLDDASKNQITVRNYTSRFQELFQRMSASTTTVETREADWSKAEILNANGTIPSSLLTTIHGENSSWVNNSIGLLNGFEQNETGITLTSLIDGNYKMKLTSFGIFLTETALQNNVWTTAISARGINADVISTGHLLTNKISILSEDQPAQIWDNLGITMYSGIGSNDYLTIKEDTFVRLDQYGLYFIEGNSSFGNASDGEPWYKSYEYNSAVKKIREEAKVSITKLGFKYNGASKNTRISVGKISKRNASYRVLSGEETDGIEFLNGNDILFRVAVDGTPARIAQFEFNKDVLQSLNKYNSSTPMIKLDGKTGKASFGDIDLFGGEINGNVKIKHAMLGPFRMFSKDATTNDRLGGMFAQIMNSTGDFNYDISHYALKPLFNWTSGAVQYQDNDDNRAFLLDKRNKFYLGEFRLTSEALARSKCNISVKNLNQQGILLSVGNVFWVHSAGYGFCNGDFHFNGTLYADEINTTNLKIRSLDVMNIIKDKKEEVVEIVNEVVGGGNMNIGAGTTINNIYNSMELGISPKIPIVYNIDGQKYTEYVAGPSLMFVNGQTTSYLVQNGNSLYFATTKDGKKYTTYLLNMTKQGEGTSNSSGGSSGGGKLTLQTR